MASKYSMNGYKPSELDMAEQRFRIKFPPDLRQLLLTKRLRDGHDWNDKEAMKAALNRPLEGLLFDVENDALWKPEWGKRPDDRVERRKVLQGVVARAPRLLPLYRHRYLPATPCETGNPVFSVVQSDIIYYGANLQDYLEREFGGKLNAPWPPKLKRIAFWSDFAEA